MKNVLREVWDKESLILVIILLFESKMILNMWVSSSQKILQNCPLSRLVIMIARLKSSSWLCLQEPSKELMIMLEQNALKKAIMIGSFCKLSMNGANHAWRKQDNLAIMLGIFYKLSMKGLIMFEENKANLQSCLASYPHSLILIQALQSWLWNQKGTHNPAHESSINTLNWEISIFN